MEFNRNHYFMLGIIALLLGFQVYKVDKYVLNEHTSELIAKKVGKEPVTDDSSGFGLFIPADTPTLSPRKEIKPPAWIGWALMSIGSVLILHSLAMTRPG